MIWKLSLGFYYKLHELKMGGAPGGSPVSNGGGTCPPMPLRSYAYEADVLL